MVSFRISQKKDIQVPANKKYHDSTVINKCHFIVLQIAFRVLLIRKNGITNYVLIIGKFISIGGFVATMYFFCTKTYTSTDEMGIWWCSISLIMISFGFWEHYASFGSSSSLTSYLAHLKWKLIQQRHSIYVFVSFFKICACLITVSLILALSGSHPIALSKELSYGRIFRHKIDDIDNIDSSLTLPQFHDYNDSFLSSWINFWMITKNSPLYVTILQLGKNTAQE